MFPSNFIIIYSIDERPPMMQKVSTVAQKSQETVKKGPKGPDKGPDTVDIIFDFPASLLITTRDQEMEGTMPAIF